MDLKKVFNDGRSLQRRVGINLPQLKSNELTSRIKYSLPSNSAAVHAQNGVLMADPIEREALPELSARYGLDLLPLQILSLHLCGREFVQRGLPEIEGTQLAAASVLFGHSGDASRFGTDDTGFYEVLSAEALGGGFEDFCGCLNRLAKDAYWIGTKSDERILAGPHLHGEDDDVVDQLLEIAEQYYLEEDDWLEAEGGFAVYVCRKFSLTEARHWWDHLRSIRETD